MRLILFVALSIVLMVLEHRQHYFVNARATLNVLVAPLQYAVDLPIRMFRVIEQGVKRQEELVRENAQLHADLLLLNAQVQQYVALEKENIQLHELLKSTPRIAGKVISARILALDSASFIHQIILDKGSQDGIYTGQPVLDANGVMGQVISVSKFTSAVLLVTDMQSAVPVQNNRTGVRAIAKGVGVWNRLLLINVAKTADIKVGDKLVTSGLDLRYPEGYPVGEISKIESDPGEHFATVEVIPSARLDRSRLVLLVWPDKKDRKLMQQISQDTGTDSK